MSGKSQAIVDQYSDFFILFFKDSPDPFAIMDVKQTDFLMMNAAMETFLTKNGISKNDLTFLKSKDDSSAYDGFVQSLAETGQAVIQGHFSNSGNTSFDVFIRAYSLNPAMSLIHMVDTSRETRKKEQELQRTWIDYFEHLFANCKDILNLFSLTQMKILRWNPQAGALMGYTQDDFAKMAIEDIYPPEELIKLATTFKRLREEKVVEEKLKLYDKSKKLKDIWIRAFVVQEEPETLCLVHTIDITNEKEIERNLLKEARLSALGEASANLAHELSNSLQAIHLNLYLVKKDNLPDSSKKRLDMIETALTHIKSVVLNIQDFTHVSSTNKSNVFISMIVEKSFQIMEGYLKSKEVEMSYDAEKNLAPIYVDPNQIQQVLMILIKNAAQAMSTSKIRKLKIFTKKDANGILELHIQDTGSGIKPEVRDRLFESFVTTKPTGIGLGLGLSIAKKLSNTNGIDISFTSELDVGTDFILTFKNAHESQQKEKKQSKVILYVDDEDSLFPSYEESLKKMNILVIKSFTPKDAIKVLLANRIDMIMCAEYMYPVSGYDFIIEAKNIFNGPICLINDSKNKAALSESGLKDPSVETLTYPCSLDSFHSKIQTMLEAGKVA